MATIIKAKTAGMRRGWGSVPVVVSVGKTSWKTSIFPDATSGSYLLPLKASMRKKEGMAEGDMIAVHLLIEVPVVVNE